jgi:hypothetical protein
MGGLPNAAFAMEERIVLMFTGPVCTQNYAAIGHTLKQTAGVRHVDFQAVPGHVLIDIETGTVTAAALEHQVNDGLTTSSSCRAEIMKSCISADLHALNEHVPSSIVRDR